MEQNDDKSLFIVNCILYLSLPCSLAVSFLSNCLIFCFPLLFALLLEGCMESLLLSPLSPYYFPLSHFLSLMLPPWPILYDKEVKLWKKRPFLFFSNFVFMNVGTTHVHTHSHTQTQIHTNTHNTHSHRHKFLLLFFSAFLRNCILAKGDDRVVFPTFMCHDFMSSDSGGDSRNTRLLKYGVRISTLREPIT